MNPPAGDVFADTAYWIALVIRQDQHHAIAQRWSLLITGRIVTTTAVLLETANSLARPAWRVAAITLLEQLQGHHDVSIVPLTPDLWRRGWGPLSDTQRQVLEHDGLHFICRHAGLWVKRSAHL